MGKLEELQDKSEKLRIWLSFWLNIVLAIFVGLASVIFAYSTNKLEINVMIVLNIVLLTFLIFVAKMVVLIWNKQSIITSKIEKENK